jgi:hypothetical protein
MCHYFNPSLVTPPCYSSLLGLTMRQQTYRTAYDEAHAELQDITVQFNELRLRKEQVERVLEALRPFIGLVSEPAGEFATTYMESEAAQTASEHVEFTFTQVSAPNGESIQMTSEDPSEQVPVGATEEQLAYFRQPSSDPFQKRIDDALWGWQQRPEGLLSPI